MMASHRKGETRIILAAIEPHVLSLVDFYRSIGVDIEITHDHTIIIHGKEYDTHRGEGTVIHDYIESGTFVILGALTAEPSIRIENARIQDLTAFLSKCHEA